MKSIMWRSLVTVIVLACCVQAQTLKKIASIDLPGPKGQRFDYLTMDDEDHWLLSASRLFLVSRALPAWNTFRAFARFTRLIGAKKRLALCP